MNSARIQALKRKFILIAMTSFVLVMLITGSMVNISYEIAMRSQMREVLDELVENEGVLPEMDQNQTSGSMEEQDNRFFAEEARRGMRYFSVIFGGEDETPEVSDYQQYDNGLRLVRSITCESEYVDQDDYQKLVDSGYYKESDITQ